MVHSATPIVAFIIYSTNIFNDGILQVWSVLTRHTHKHTHIIIYSPFYSSLGACWYQFKGQKSAFPREPCFSVTFSGVLYPQMRPPTKQASKFRSTAKTNHRSLISWDLVWPPVFKHLCHVSSNWYLMFGLLPSDLDFSLLSFILFSPPNLPSWGPWTRSKFRRWLALHYINI